MGKSGAESLFLFSNGELLMYYLPIIFKKINESKSPEVYSIAFLKVFVDMGGGLLKFCIK